MSSSRVDLQDPPTRVSQWLIRLPSKTWWSSCLSLPNTELTGPCHAWLYYNFWNPTWVLMITCKHLTNWVISQCLARQLGNVGCLYWRNPGADITKTFFCFHSSQLSWWRNEKLQTEKTKGNRWQEKVEGENTSFSSRRAMCCLISGTRRVWIAFEAANLTRGLFYTWNYDLIILIRISLWLLGTDSGWCHRPGIRIWCFRVESNTRKMKQNTLYWQSR